MAGCEPPKHAPCISIQVVSFSPALRIPSNVYSLAFVARSRYANTGMSDRLSAWPPSTPGCVNGGALASTQGILGPAFGLSPLHWHSWCGPCSIYREIHSSKWASPHPKLKLHSSKMDLPHLVARAPM
eukprot:4836778-Amphidinium_carterae.1